MAKNLKARPVCDVCQKPVEEFTEEEGDGALRGWVIFVARCHGKVERQKCPRRLTAGLNFAKAFVVSPGLPPIEQPEENPYFTSRTKWFLTGDGPRIIKP